MPQYCYLTSGTLVTVKLNLSPLLDREVLGSVLSDFLDGVEFL